MTEKEFKDHYVATFLATFMANRFKRDFFESNISDLYRNQPIKEADIIADLAWNSFKNHQDQKEKNDNN